MNLNFVKILMICGAIVALSPLPSHADAASKQTTSKEVIERFYHRYLSSATQQKKPELLFSHSFRKLIDKDAKVCRLRAGTDICGWGADGDVYLDGQEYNPESYEKSGAVVTAIDSKTVQIKLNIYPSTKDTHAYDREISFQMIREGGQWAVDNIIYKSGNARAQIQAEINIYTTQK